MDPENFKQAWQAQTAQTRLTIDAALLRKEVERNQQYLSAMVFWRDVREVGVSLLLLPVWLYLGVTFSLPWSWYLTVPALLWIAGYMLADRMRHGRRPPEPGEPLRLSVETSLAQVEHQIGVLRSVHWWYLLPLALAMLAFVAQVAWQSRSIGWEMMAGLLLPVVVLGLIVFASVYWLNQHAVRSALEPRRRELETLLSSLADETPDAS
jgi:hypothetical protein